jgi:hypothetical protein
LLRAFGTSAGSVQGNAFAGAGNMPSPEFIDALAIALADRLVPAIKTAAISGTPSASTESSSSSAVLTSAQNAGTMEELGGKTHTDKVYHHGYHRFYPFFLEPVRAKNAISPIKMLEIGYLHGESFEMWKLYFPGATILYMEKDRQGPESKHYHVRITSILLDLIYLIIFFLYSRRSPFMVTRVMLVIFRSS